MRIGAIINPRAGGWARLRAAQARQDPEEAVTRWLAPEAPESIWVRQMRAAGDGAHLACDAIAQGCDTLIAVGGDGTINDIVQGIRSTAVSVQPRLGLLPMGTANVLARVLGLPRHDPQTAAQVIRNGKEQQIDLGCMGERSFALVAGIGFDGAVTQAVNMRLKRRIGEWAYIVAATQVALSYPRRTVRLTLDEGAPRTFDAYLILIANGGRYAGRFQLGPAVSLSDGLLDVFVCLRRRPFMGGVASDALALTRNRLAQAPGVRHFRARTIVLDADHPLPIELDGDSAGATPARIEVVPQALRVLVP
jgi:YegS/Rv2252/BmrU family lipid kinase